MKIFAVCMLIYTSLFAQTPPQENNYDTLEAVEVSEYKEKKPMIVQHEDKTVVNVQDSPIMQASANLFDVLKKTPRLYVSPEDDVQITGLGSAVILLNGKPVPKQMLYGILPSQIKEVEVMDNPTARFKAIAQSSVIVNIITIESPRNQWYINPSLNAGGGFHQKTWFVNGQIAAGLQLEKWTVRGGYNYMPTQGYYEFDNKLELAGISNITKKIGKFLNLNSHNYNLGIDYEINKKQAIALNYGGSYRSTNQETEYQNIDNNRKLKQENTYLSHNFSLDYNFKIDTTGKNLDAHFIYIQDNFKQDFPIWILGDPDYNFKENNLKESFTASLNYEQPFLKSFTWNTGFFIQYARNYLDFQGFLLNNIVPSNGFFQEINSTLYNTVKYNWKKWTYTLGLSLSESFSEIKQNPIYNKQNQFNWSPDFRLHYMLNEKYNFGASYNYSFIRPNLYNMLHYSVTDPSLSFVGNPNLKTTENHNFNLKASLFQALTIYTGYTFSQNVIEYFQDGNINRSINNNRHSLFFGIGYQYQYKFWTMHYAFNMNYAKSRIQAYRSLPVPNFNISQSFSIPKDFSVDVSYSYYSMNTGNVRVSDNQNLNLSLSKRFPKQNIHLILSYADVANLESKTKISFGDTQTIYAKGKNSGINFTARYNFGQELSSKVKTDNVSSRL